MLKLCSFCKPKTFLNYNFANVKDGTIASRLPTWLLNRHFKSRATKFIQSSWQKARLAVLNAKQSTSSCAPEIVRPPSERLDRILRITVREDDGIIEPRNLFSSVQVFYDDDIARQALRRKLKLPHGEEDGKRGKRDCIGGSRVYL